VGPGDFLVNMEKRKIFPIPRIEPQCYLEIKNYRQAEFFSTNFFVSKFQRAYTKSPGFMGSFHCVVLIFCTVMLLDFPAIIMFS
jgi:hypothetical protein